MKKVVHKWLGPNRTVTCCGLLSHRHSNFLARKGNPTCKKCKKIRAVGE